ncbi:MAG: hypothetical protein F4201_08870, partial [Nitrospira sp. SB0677_bin_15]|nr:hypothetical protein [Nitrospira sp. SB0677_bin_15]
MYIYNILIKQKRSSQSTYTVTYRDRVRFYPFSRKRRSPNEASGFGQFPRQNVHASPDNTLRLAITSIFPSTRSRGIANAGPFARHPYHGIISTLLCLVLLILAPLPAAAQSHSLSISPTEITSAGGTITITPKNATFVGAELADLRSEGNAAYPLLFNDPTLFSFSAGIGILTNAWRQAITLTNAPAGMRVTGVVLKNRVQGVHGLAANQWHRELVATIGYAGAQLSADLNVVVTVDESLLRFADGNGVVRDPDEVATSGNLSGSLTIRAIGTGILEFADTPVRLTEGGSGRSYRVALRTDPGSNVTVTVTPTSSDTSIATVSPVSLTFTGGNTGTWQTPQMITVTPLSDADGVDEVLHVSHALSGLSGATDGGNVGVSVADDETVGVIVKSRSHRFYSEDPPGGRSPYSIRLATMPTAPVTISGSVSDFNMVNVLTVDGSAPTSLTFTLTFSPSDWETPKIVELGRGPSGSSGTATISHTASSTDVNYNGINVQSVTVNHVIGVRGLDTDFLFSERQMDVSEDTSVQYNVQLLENPGKTVTVRLVVNDPGALTVSPATLTFKTSDWNQPQTVTATPVTDSDGNDESVSIGHILGQLTTARAADSIAVTVQDTVTAGIEFDTSLVDVWSDTLSSYRLRLNTKPAGDVRVTVTIDFHQYVTFSMPVSRVELDFTPSDWNQWQQIELAHGGGLEGSAKLLHTVSSPKDTHYHNHKVELAGRSRGNRPSSSSPRAVLSVVSSQVEEGGSLSVKITLKDGVAPSTAKIIPLIYTNGSAEPADYTGTVNVLIPANQRVATATVPITDDTLHEDAETFTVAMGTLPFGIDPPLSTETSSAEVTIGASDKPEISVTADAMAVAEGNAAGFTLTTSNPVEAAVTIALTVSQEGEYVDPNNVGGVNLTLSPGATSLNFDVATKKLPTDNPSGSVTVTLNDSTGYTVVSDASSATVKVRDTDATTVALAAPLANVSETGGKQTLTVTLGRALTSGESLSLPLAVTGTAGLGTDYTLAAPDPLPSGVTYENLDTAPTLVFTGPSAATATLDLSVTADALDEGTGETVSIALPALGVNSGTGLDGGASGSGNAAFTIDDDDDAPEVTIERSGGSLTEGGTAAFTIRVNGEAQNDLSIDVTVSQVGDFVAANLLGDKSLDLTSGTTSLSYTVATSADSMDERSGSVTVVVKPGTGYTVGDAGSATVTVTDDDPTRVVLSSSAFSKITENGGKFTITVDIHRGLVHGEVLRLPLTVTGTAELGADYTLAAPNPLPTGVTYETLDSIPTIIFTGPNTGKTATSADLLMTGKDDNLKEDDLETVAIALPALDASSGSGLDAGATGSGSVTVNVEDNDLVPSVSIALQGSSAARSEGENVVLLISAGGSSSDRALSIGLDVTQTGAFLDAGETGSLSLTIPSGQHTVSHTLTTISDLIDEPSGSVTVRLLESESYTRQDSRSSVTVNLKDDDATVVTLSVPGGNVSENGGVKTITVSLGRELVNGESLPVRLTFGGSATFGTDYALSAPSPLPTGVTYGNLGSTPTITFTGGTNHAHSATLTLRATADTLVEDGAESVTVGLAPFDVNAVSSLDGGARGEGEGAFSITDASTAPAISVSGSAAVVEGMAAKFTINASAVATTSRTVNLTVTGTSGVAADGVLGSRSVVIAANETSVIVSVPTLADAVDEVAGSVTVTVNSGSGYTIASGAGSASVDVTDDDPTSVTLAATDTTATESDGTDTGRFTVTLGRALGTGESLAVPLSVTGVASTEYTLALTQATGIAFANGTLTFTGGTNAATTAVVTFAALADGDTDIDVATIAIPASSASGSPRMTATGLDGGANGTGTVKIVITDAGATGGVTLNTATVTVDEGGEGRYSVVLNSDPGGNVTVTASLNLTDVTLSPSSLSFMGGASGTWNTPQWITVVAAEDGNVTNESGTVTHTVTGYTGVTSAASVTVSVNDAGQGFIISQDHVTVVATGNTTYTIRLKSQPTSNVVLDLTSDDETAATVSTPVTITPGAWQSGESVTVTGVAAGSATISHAHASGSDTGYAGLAVPGNVTVSVLAGAVPQIGISAQSASVTEGGTAIFDVTSDGTAPESGITVTLAGAQEGSFVNGALPGTVTILEGATSASLSITTLDDGNDERDGSITYTVQPDAAYGLTTGAKTKIDVVDNDPTSVTLSRSGSNNIAETGGETSLTVTLGRPLVEGEILPVELSFSGQAVFGTDYTLGAPTSVPAGIGYLNLSSTNLESSPPTIRFTGSSDSSATASLRILAASDSLVEGNEAVSVTPKALDSNSGTGLGGGASSTGSASFSIKDDDSVPTVSIEAGSGVTEGAAASFTIRAAPTPTSALTVHLVVGQTGDFVAASNAGAKTVTINSGSASAMLTVSTRNDAADEPDGAVTVALAPGNGYAVSGSNADATVAVSDDDATGITLSAPDGHVAEDGGRKEIALALNRQLASGETLSQALSFSGGASLGTDYTLSEPSPGPAGVTWSGLTGTPTVTFTGGAGASPVATLILTASADTHTENALESVKVRRGTLSDGTLSGGATGAGAVDFSISDADRPTLPRISIQAGQNVTEGSAVSFTISSDTPAPMNGLRIFYTVSEQGKFVGSVGANKSVLLTNGQSSITLTITTNDDSRDEARGAVTVAIASNQDYVVDGSAGIGTVQIADNDPTGVTLSAKPGGIAETGGTKIITVTLDRTLVSGETLTVPISVSGVGSDDYTLSPPSTTPAGVTYALGANPPTITFTGGANASISATFTLSAEHDVRDEGAGETVTVGLGTPTASASLGGANSSGTATFIIVDDDGTPVISVEAGDTVTEGSNAVFTLTASPPPQENVSVSLSVSQVGDFVASSGLGSQSITIAANASEVTYTVATVADNSDERSGSVTVTIEDGSGYHKSQADGDDSVNVTDDDKTTATLSVTDSTATEFAANDKARIRIQLPRSLIDGEKLIVPLTFTGGAIGTDFSLEGGTGTGVTADGDTGIATFTGGAGAAAFTTFDVIALADADEVNDTITVGLGTLVASNLDGGADTTVSGNAQITLADAGPQPAVDAEVTSLQVTESGTGQYRLKLHTDPGAGTVTVTPSSADATLLTVSGPLSFNTTNWNNWQSVTVTSLNDGDLVANTVTITHTVTGYGSVTKGPDIDVTVTDRGRGVTVTPTVASIAEGATTSYSIVLHSAPAYDVTVTPASGDDGTATTGAAVTFSPAMWNSPKTIQVTGINTGNTTITHAITSADSGYAAITPEAVSVSVSATARVRASVASLTVEEHSADGTYTLWLNTNPGVAVTVTPRTTSNAITLSGAVTFNAGQWDQAQTVTVSVNADTDGDSESAVITHDVTGYPGVARGPDLPVTVQDSGSRVLVSTASLTITMGETATYNVTTATLAANTVIIIPTSNVSATASVSPLARTFDSDEDRTQQFTVTGNAVGTTVITHEVKALPGSGYEGVTAPSLAVEVTPARGVTITPQALNLVEGNTRTYDVSLVSNPNGSVTVTPTSSDTSVATVSGALTFNASTWKTPQQVTVTAKQDSDKLDGSTTITHAVSGYGSVTSGPNVQVAVRDDERLPEISVTTAQASVTEGDDVTFTVSADELPLNPVTVTLTLTGGDGYVASEDRGSQTVTIPVDQGSKDLVVPTQTDDVDEPFDFLTATVTANAAAYTIAASPANAAEVKLVDNDATTVTLNVPSENIDEVTGADGAKTLTITLGRTLVQGESLSAKFAFGGDATLGTDYTLAAPSPVPSGLTYDLDGTEPAVTFSGPSPVSATLTLNAEHDEIDEGDGESVSVSLAPFTSTDLVDLGGGATRSGDGQFDIEDNDEQTLPLVSIDPPSTGITEGGTATFTVNVNESPATNLDVTVTVNDAQYSDFLSNSEEGSRTVTIDAGTTSKTFTVSTQNDSGAGADEPAGQVTARVEDGNNVYDADPAKREASVTVTDNDPTRVTLTTPDASATEGSASDSASIDLTLGRGLVSGESLAVPLLFSNGTAGTDFNLALSGTPAGVSFDSNTSTVTFTGPSTGQGATVSTLTLNALVDNDADDDVVTASIPSRSTGNEPKLTATGLDGGATGTRTGNGRITLHDVGLNLRTIGWGTTTLSVPEGTSTQTTQRNVTAALSSGTGPVTFRVCLDNRTATRGTSGDYRGFGSTDARCTGTGSSNPDISIGSSESSQTVTLQVNADGTDEPDETFTATLSLPTTVAGLGINPDIMTITIVDDDPTVVSLARTDSGSINEGEKTEFTVSLGRTLISGETIDVPFSISGTGVTTSDWSLALKSSASNTNVSLSEETTATPTVRFSGAGAETATLELATLADGAAEGSGETINVALGTNQQFDADPDTNVGGGADPSSTQASFSVLVNDPRTIGWSTTTLAVTEGTSAQATQRNVTAALSSGTGPVTFRVCLDNRTATRGTSGDYRGFGSADARCTGTGSANPDISIGSSESSRTVTLQVNADGTDEPDKTFSATLSLPTPVVGLSVNPALMTITIEDDDPTVVSLARVGSGVVYEADKVEFTVSLNRALISGETIDVPLSISGTSVTTGDWSLALKSSASNTNVSLSEETTATPTVRFSGAGAETATLELTATVDGVTETGGETVTVALGTNQQFDADPDTNVGGGADPSSTQASFNVTVNDGRTIGWDVITVPPTTEGASATVNARLSSGTGPVTFRVCLNDVTATRGTSGDYRGFGSNQARCTGTGGSNQDFSIGSSQSSLSVSLPTTSDNEDEPRETFTATLSLHAPAPGLSLDTAQATTTVTIVDDTPTTVQLSAPAGDVSENGGRKTVTVRLERALVSPESLTVPLTFEGNAVRGTDYAVTCTGGTGVDCTNPTALVFTGGPGAERSAALTLTGITDTSEEGPETVTISLGELNASSGTNLDGGARAEGTGRVEFRVTETLTHAFVPAEYTVNEGGSVFLISALSQPVTEGAVWTRYEIVHGTAGASDVRPEVSYTPDSILIGQTHQVLRVSTLLDNEVEGTETFTVRAKRLRHYSDGHRSYEDLDSTNVATVTIYDSTNPLPGSKRQPPAVTIAPVASPVVEGAPAEFTLTMTPAPDAQLTAIVDVAVVPRVPGVTTGLHLVTIDSTGEATLSVATDNNDVAEDAHGRVTAKVLHGNGYMVYRNSSAAVTVNDNDGAPPAVTITRMVETVREGDSASFTVKAGYASASDLTVYLNVAESGGGDYVASSDEGRKTVTIDAGKTEAVYTVATDDDASVEADGTLRVTVVDTGANYTVGAPASAEVALTDDGDFEITYFIDKVGAAEGNVASYGSFYLTMKQPLAAGKTVTIPITFTGGAIGTDFTLALDAAYAKRFGSAALQADTGTITLTGPTNARQSLIVRLFAREDDDMIDEVVTVSPGTRSTSGGGEVGSHLLFGNGQITLFDNDVPQPLTVEFTRGTFLVYEYNSPVDPVLRISEVPRRDIPVTITLTDVTTKRGEDYPNKTTYTATFKVGDSQQTAAISIPILNDALEEGDETFTVAIDAASLPEGVTPKPGGIIQSTVTVFDDDLPTVGFASGAVSAVEGQEAKAVLVLSRPFATDVSVTVEDAAGTATASDDYTPGPYTVVFSAGETGATLAVPTASDSIDDDGETFTLSIPESGIPAKMKIAQSQTTVTLTDATQTSAVPIAAFSTAVTNATENGGTRAVRVTLDRAPTAAVTLDYTLSGSATQGEDWTIAGVTDESGTVRVSAGTTHADITVRLVNNGENEPTETLILTLTDGSGYVVGGHNVHTLTIADDDAPPTSRILRISAGTNTVSEGDEIAFDITATPAPPAPLNVKVQITESGRFISGSRTRTVSVGTDGTGSLTVATVNDTQDEPNGDITATIVNSDFPSRVAIKDDDATQVTLTGSSGAIPEAGGTRQFSVRLARALVEPEALIVPLVFSGEATADVDYTVVCATATGIACHDLNGGAEPRIVFIGTEGASRTATLTLTATNDTVAEGADETVTVALGTLDADSGAHLDGGATGMGSITLTITDDEAFTVTPALTALYEDDGSRSFTVSGIDDAHASVVVRTGADGTATRDTDGTWDAGEDYRLLRPGNPDAVLGENDTLSPSNGDVAFKVEIRDDGAEDGEDEEAIVLILDLPDATPDQALGTLALRNGPRPYAGVDVSVKTFSIHEGNTQSYTVMLTQAPADGTTVTVTARSNSDKVRVSAGDSTPGVSAALTFTHTDWNVPRTVTLSVPHDIDARPDTATVGHEVRGTGAYRDVTGPEVHVSVVDDDLPVLVSVTAGDDVTEGNSATFTVSAAPTPRGLIRVALTLDETGAFFSPSETNSRTVILTPTHTSTSVRIETEDDKVNEAHGAASLTIEDGYGYQPATGDARQASLRVLDNDGAGLPVVRIASPLREGETVFEGATLRFKLHADPAPTADLAVGVTVEETNNAFVDPGSNGTGTRQVTILAGASSAEVTVETVNDTAHESPPTATVEVKVDAGTGYAVAPEPDNSAKATVSDNDGLPSLSIADAEADEGSIMLFEVTLSRAAAHEVEVRCRTKWDVLVNGSAPPGVAHYGRDYEIRSTRLSFKPGETRTIFSVITLDDTHDDTEETFEVELSDPQGAVIARGTATGTIFNDDPLPASYLARFGRTVAEQILDGVSTRIETARIPGFQGTIPRMSAGTGAGQPGGTQQNAGNPRDGFGNGVGDPNQRDLFGTQPAPMGAEQDLTIRDLLAGSAFMLTGKPDDRGGSFALWGRGAQATFNGQEKALGLNGTVTTGLLGVDYARPDWLVGLMLARSEGDGGYNDPGVGTGTLESSLTAALPYASWQASPRLRLWGTAGYGAGEVLVTPKTSQTAPAIGDAMKADIDWTMASAGAQGDLLAPGSGPALALVSDALWTHTASDQTGQMTASESTVTRLRLGLKGRWIANLGEGDTLTPKLEAGVRHDGGDAETGFGMEVGGGLNWTTQRLGVSLNLEGRTLLTHEANGFKDQGFAAAFVFDPDQASERGPSLRIRQDFGSQASGGLDGLFAANPLSRRTSNPLSSRWTTEAAYGFPVFGGHFTGSPQVAVGFGPGERQYTLGGRLTPAGPLSQALSFGLKATRRENAINSVTHGVEVELSIQW